MAKQSAPKAAPRQAAPASARRAAAPAAAARPEAFSRSAALGDIVSILMRAPKHKAMPLDSLRQFVLPAIMHNQYRIARVRKAGNTAASPAGFAIWASVSEAVDQRLRATKQQPISLAYEEWKSGPILWLIDLVAPSAIAGNMLTEIDEKIGNGKPVFTHIVSAQGAMRMTTVGDLVASLKKIPA